MNAPTTQLVILSLVVWILSKFGNQRGWKIFCPWNSFSKGFLGHLPPLKSLLKNLGLIFDFICPGFEEWLITKISIKAQVGAFLNKFSRLNVELKIVELSVHASEFLHIFTLLSISSLNQILQMCTVNTIFRLHPQLCQTIKNENSWIIKRKPCRIISQH